MMNYIISALAIFSFFYFIKEVFEVLFLKRVLLKILNKKRIETKDDIIKIKHFLNENISYTIENRYNRRPLLRHTAKEVLESKYGFCGENARVAIKLFLLSGIRARRIYLFRKEWQHVLIEHEYQNKWYMFDGHHDPDTILKDKMVANIPSENISKYPNDYSNNPYLDFCRIKLFRNLIFLDRLSKQKLPSFVVYFLESPQLLKSFILLFLCCCLIFLK